MNQIVFLLLLIILALGLPLVFNISNILEGYSNYSLDQATGKYPELILEFGHREKNPLLGLKKNWYTLQLY